MVRPSHRLDLLLVPADPAAADQGEELLRELIRDGIVVGDGTPGPRSRDWSPEGFARITLDRPGRTVLYANRQGGFQVRCPVTGDPIAREFGRALTLWREGRGPLALACACGQDHPFGQLAFAPPVAFGSFAVVTVDIGAPELSSEAMERCRARLGSLRVILARG